MNIYSQFGTDRTKEKEGVWIDYGLNDHGNPQRFKVSRIGKSNPEFRKCLEKVIRPHRRAIEANLLPLEQQESLYAKVFVKVVLLGWENILDREGKEIPFSEDNATALLKDLPDLYDDLQAQAAEIGNFQEEEEQTEIKN